MIEARTFALGRFTIVLRPELDHTCPLYRVYLGDVLIGKSLSIPDLGCCEWLYRQQRDQTFYAYSSAPLPELTNALHRRLANRKRGAPRKAETLRDIAKALSGG